ncbi:MAG: pilus assembly protein [Deltaproteobacteria bacterium]|nr:pilus assembly protein [Deltaproteobacteria bacterium]
MRDKESGQTLIETVFVLFILLLLILGIAEFARAWYVKNSLNNAARVGARAGAVTPGLLALPATPCNPTPVNAAAKAACDSLSMSPLAKINVNVTVCLGLIDPSTGVCTTDVSAGSNPSALDAGDTVTVRVNSHYAAGVSTFKILSPWLTTLYDLSSQASMRYEL